LWGGIDFWGGFGMLLNNKFGGVTEEYGRFQISGEDSVNGRIFYVGKNREV
jgi:hypothetical protein